MAKNKTQIKTVMAAAECRGLAKVGGLGDVVRDLAPALLKLGVDVAVCLPLYDTLHCEAEPVAQFDVEFGSIPRKVELLLCEEHGFPVYLVKNGDFFSGTHYGQIYVDSSRLGHGPFEDDAKRFAFFSAAVAEALLNLPAFKGTTTLHCHDWHTGPLLTLLRYDPHYQQLRRRLRTLFTIHNLEYQGARPLHLPDDRAMVSFAGWFPALYRTMKREKTLGEIASETENSYNPMLAAIRLADTVNTVSPTYAGEITRPDNPAANFKGGRGLETELRALAAQQRLPGILNGIDYGKHDPAALQPPFSLQEGGDVSQTAADKERFKRTFLEHLPERLSGLASRPAANFKNYNLMRTKLAQYDADKWINRPLVTAVTRAVPQKMGLLLSRLEDGRTVLEKIAAKEIGLIVLGSGMLENQLSEYMTKPNMLFVNAFDAGLAAELYGAGDLFLMPSDFEPCGISQMISMRYGCLPLVHDIGGLHDTVKHGQTGFAYRGGSVAAQQQALLNVLDGALDMKEKEPLRWQRMIGQAMLSRFVWEQQAREYLRWYE